MPRSRTAEEILRRLVFLGGPTRAEAAVHIEQIEAREASYADWPTWADPLLVERLRETGVERPWSHQAEAAELLHAGRHTVLATGTASGKSAGYLLPALSRLLSDANGGKRTGTVLYLAPTKALAADQARRLRELDLPMPPAVCLDGDTSGAGSASTGRSY